MRLGASTVAGKKCINEQEVQNDALPRKERIEYVNEAYSFQRYERQTQKCQSPVSKGLGGWGSGSTVTSALVYSPSSVAGIKYHGRKQLKEEGSSSAYGSIRTENT